jgi:hypothetical protein
MRHKKKGIGIGVGLGTVRIYVYPPQSSISSRRTIRPRLPPDPGGQRLLLLLEQRVGGRPSRLLPLVIGVRADAEDERAGVDAGCCNCVV